MNSEPRRNELGEEVEEGEGRVRTGDRDRLQHLTGCPGEPLKVIEREKRHIWRERGGEEIERKRHAL